MSMTRREFVATAGAVGLGGLFVSEAQARFEAAVGGPIAIASANGARAVERAVQRIQQGVDPLDAVVEGVNIVEDDPNDHSVGYGGLPNEEGVVELDACVMDGRSHRAGGVAGIQRIRNPSRVAAIVMRRTDHVLLVGDGARRFARAHGFQEQELLTDEARKIWLEWKETHSDKDDWLHPDASGTAAHWRMRYGENFTWGTISCLALTLAGDLVGCTSTSGLSYKIPGRVGDSPIIGAGLYVDGEVGGCGSTGRGEANLLNCSSFLAVEHMRAGMTPEDACRKVLERIAAKTEPRLRTAAGEPAFDLTFYALRRDGLVGGATMRGSGSMCVHDASGARKVVLPGLFAAKSP